MPCFRVIHDETRLQPSRPKQHPNTSKVPHEPEPRYNYATTKLPNPQPPHHHERTTTPSRTSRNIEPTIHPPCTFAPSSSNQQKCITGSTVFSLGSDVPDLEQRPTAARVSPAGPGAPPATPTSLWCSRSVAIRFTRTVVGNGRQRAIRREMQRARCLVVALRASGGCCGFCGRCGSGIVWMIPLLTMGD
jgi:hypothetical protein